MIQVIERVENILEYISAQNNREIPLSEIADSLGMNRATCANILKTMKMLGLVEQSDYRKGYIVGPKIYSLAGVRNNTDSMVRTLKPIVDKLCKEVNENVMIATIRNGRRVLPYYVKGNHQIEARTVEEMTPWNATTAKVIIAHYSIEKLNNLIKQIGMPGEYWPEITSKNDLIEELSKIKERQFETVINNHFACIVAPVFKHEEVVASIGVFLPDIRLSHGRREMLETRIVQCARDASDLLSK